MASGGGFLGRVSVRGVSARRGRLSRRVVHAAEGVEQLCEDREEQADSEC